MAGKLDNLRNAFKDTKTRAFLLIAFFIIIVAIGIGYFGLKSTEKKGASPEAKLQKVPSGVKSIPTAGEAPSREYVQLQEEENLRRAQEALKKGGSAIPTITRTTYIGQPEELQPTAATTTPGDCSVEALTRARQAGVKAEELRCKGCTAAQLRAAGYTAGELMNAGFSAKELRDAGFSAAELRAAGFTAAELARAGFSPAELVAAGYSAAELSQAGVAPEQLSNAGMTTDQLTAAGIGIKTTAGLPKDCSVEALRQARSQGVSAAALRKMGCGAAALRAAGYTAKELKDAGFSAKELRDAGFSPSELRNAGFSAGELRQAGFSADELKAAGFSAGELRDAGFDAAELAKAGFSADELKAAGFSDGELTRAGIAPATPPQPIAVTPEQPVVAAAPQPAAAAAPTEASSLPSISGEPGSIAALQQLQARQAERLSAQERQDRIGQLQQTMATQASDLFASWSPPSSQQYVAGQEPKQQGTTSPGAIVPAANAQLLSAASQYPSVKAGTILFGVMDTSVNSDEPGPILATIVEGPYKGSRLLGQFQRVEKRLLLSFTIMNVPSLPQSVGINAVAIDPDDARTALATHVDSHYLLRFGTLFASSFITGLGNAISQSDSTTNITVSGISTTTASKSAAEQGLMALGEVGKQFGSVLAPIYTKPPTVTLDAGTGIGVLFMADANISASAPAAAPIQIMPTASTGAIAPAAATATPATQTSGTVMPALSSNILTLPLQTQAQGQIQQASQAVQTAGQTLIK